MYERAEGNGAGRVLVGRYRLGERLGRGGMGTVWRAQDLMLDREVAVKELSVGHLAREDLFIVQSRMKQEARAAARIRHPGVITVHDVLEQDGNPWIVMELIDGRSLAERVEQEGPLPVAEAAGIGARIVAALDQAHRAGVVHRDVKPANVLLEHRTGRVVLTDFGIATYEGDSALTRTGDVLGSPDYLAPECFDGTGPGRASDLWGLGATLYAAVEGRPPFHRDSPLATLAAAAGEPLPEPHRAAEMASILHDLLAKRPQDRPLAAEVLVVLEAIAARGDGPQAEPRLPDGTAIDDGHSGTPTESQRTLPAAVPTATGTGAPIRSRRRPRRRRIRVLPLIAGCSVAVLTVGIVVAISGRHPTTGPGASASTAPPVSSSSAASTAPAAPAGYTMRHDPAGFTFPLPVTGRTWTRSGEGLDAIDYSPDGDKEHLLTFGVTPGQGLTPVEHARQMAQEVVQHSRSYRLVALDPDTFKGSPGARWEFTFTQNVDGTLQHRHAIEELYRDHTGTEYDIYVAVPESDWTTGYTWFLQIADEFTTG